MWERSADIDVARLGDSSSLFDEDNIPPQDWLPPLARTTSTKMVNERQPPKANTPAARAVPGPLKDLAHNSVEFGKVSPLRNQLKADASHIFNVPKQNRPRPEHHRPTPTSKDFVPPRGLPSSEPRPVEIFRPANPPGFATQPAPKPTFSSLGTTNTFQPINASNPPRSVIDLTAEKGSNLSDNLVDLTTENDGFDPNKALADSKFGAPDPFAYVEAAKANDDIKALLEGAFGEDDEKPRTRRRKKALEDAAAANNLAAGVGALSVGTDRHDTEDTTDDEEDDGSVEGLNVKLLPHQVEGVAWMTDREVGKRKKNGVLPNGGILADDMGLGKTIQSVALILTNPRPPKHANTKDSKQHIPIAVSKSTLVVAPLALIRQWEDEIKTKVCESHSLRVRVHHGPSRTKSSDELKRNDVVITTYQTLTSEHAGSSNDEDGIKIGCFGVHWYRVILDEAHSIKNRNAKSTQACYALNSQYRWCLTGTPMQNNLDELQSLIRFLRIKPYDQLKRWKEEITGPMKSGRGRLAMKRLQYFLSALMKRRTKDVLKQEGALNFGGKSSTDDTEAKGFKIVERRVEDVVAQFTPNEQAFYDRLANRAERSLERMMESKATDYIGALVLLLRLRQVCNHADLVKASFSNDKDALTTGSGVTAGSQPKAAGSSDVDDIAGMMGALSVDTKQCDVCKSPLSQSEKAAGVLRCNECEEDLAEHDKSQQSYGVDEEEGEGDWVVPKGEQHATDLGKAGGTDDENVEGGGDTLNSEDSETDDEGDVETKPPLKRHPVNLVSSDEEDGSDSSDADTRSSKIGIHKRRFQKDFSNQSTSRLVASTKIRRLIEILRNECKDHKFIVFSQFTSMLDIIEPFLREENFTFTRYDGSMRNDQREASLNRLRNDRKTRVLLCSLKCGSLGLNLTAASRVVIMEPFWNPFVEEQAIDRVHRLNQTVDVVVYKLTIANTVEERILDLQAAKRKLANAAIDGGRAISKLSMKDILQLFRRDAEHYHQPDEHDHAFSGSTRVLPSSSAGAAAETTAPTVIARDRHKEKRPMGLHEDPIYGRR